MIKCKKMPVATRRCKKQEEQPSLSFADKMRLILANDGSDHRQDKISKNIEMYRLFNTELSQEPVFHSNHFFVLDVYISSIHLEAALTEADGERGSDLLREIRKLRPFLRSIIIRMSDDTVDPKCKSRLEAARYHICHA